MNPKTPLVVGALLFMAWAVPISADPVTFKEVSVLLRMKEPQAEIESQIAKRKLHHPFSPPQLATLRTEGASDALLRTLQDPRFFLSAKEADQFNRKKDASLAAIKRDQEKFAQDQAARASAKVSSPADERSTEFKYAKEAVQWGKALNLSKFGGPNIDIFVKSRVGTSYAVDIANNERPAPVARVVAKANGASPVADNPPAPEPVSLPAGRARVRIEKRDPARIPTERGDLYLIYLDKASGIHVYFLDDNAAPINTDMLIVSPKKF